MWQVAGQKKSLFLHSFLNHASSTPTNEGFSLTSFINEVPQDSKTSWEVPDWVPSAFVVEFCDVPKASPSDKKRVSINVLGI